ncbi:MAG: hypothetical protein QOH60_2108 [Mycobacterium sp.]|jgi:hypothetical protein|nr:hypothetical protein [Mycobacterium sp.]
MVSLSLTAAAVACGLLFAAASSEQAPGAGAVVVAQPADSTQRPVSTTVPPVASGGQKTVSGKWHAGRYW